MRNGILWCRSTMAVCPVKYLSVMFVRGFPQLQGARMRIARSPTYLVCEMGQAEPAPRDPRGGGFGPGDAAAFAAASAPSC
jgi:hypothetical protein